MHIIDGKALAEELRQDLAKKLKNSQSQPFLAVLLVGDDPASALYVKLKKKAAEEIGIRVEITHKDDSTSEEELTNLIQSWNRNPAIHGILVQLPLPARYNEQRIIDLMDPKKDADGFHPEYVAALYRGEAAIIPPVHEGILRLISKTPVHVNGARTVIFGNSEIFTKPLERLLSSAGAVVTRLSANDVGREEVQDADIVISAIGTPHFIQPKQVKPTAVLIDVGTTKVENEKLAGDVDFNAFKETDCWITPVPGGVGPMTIAQLLWNVFALAERAKNQA